MLEVRFPAEPAEETKEAVVAGDCKCGRCTRNGEQSDSSMASSDLG